MFDLFAHYVGLLFEPIWALLAALGAVLGAA